MAYANIIIDISHEKVDKTFQYKVPKELEEMLSPGMQVLIPFGNGNRMTRGYVLELTEKAEFEESRMKEIASIDQEGVSVEGELIALAAWIRKQYGGTMNQALKTVLPVKQKTQQREKRTLVLNISVREAKKWLEQFQKKHHTARLRLLEALVKEKRIPYEVVTGKLNIKTEVIRAMEEMGILTVERKLSFRNPISGNVAPEEPVLLNQQQQRAVEGILKDLEQEKPKVSLIHGVTGSGKTAVYLELIAEMASKGKQSIVLIPEIALTYQTVVRFYRRFGERVSILNSRMSPGERYDQFLRAKNGELDVMIGPRSALFTPFPDLGLILIDEEHEASYKSETIPRYHARETAIARAKLAGAGVVLGSATPSVESYARAMEGTYRLYEMDSRVLDRPLPECEVVDLREELKQGNRSVLSSRLQSLMEDRLSRGQQIMLFINRRGMSGFVSCRSCGHVFRCSHCDVSLNHHNNGKLVCHYCGYEEAAVRVCPVCGSKFVSGFKAGTQKVEELVKKRFPNARILRMDYDTTRKKEGYEQILSAFANQEADILIGTQMIVKGHDFPNVTLVGILAADLSLHTGDYRGGERTFQLLTQAAGRAGRGMEKGHVVIQTYSPTHYSIQLAAKQDYKGFFQQEIAYRSLMKYPPVWHMLVMLVASRDSMYGSLCADLLGKKVEQAMEKGKISGLSMIGPADAAVAKVNDIYKKVIYFKHEEYSVLVRIKDALEEFVRSHREFQDVTIQFDFNPMNGF